MNSVPTDSEILKLARSEAKWFANKRGGWGQSHFDDLVQTAAMGLLHARTKYDPSRTKFTTYGIHWSRQYMRRFYRQHGAVVVGNERTDSLESVSMTLSHDAIDEGAEEHWAMSRCPQQDSVEEVVWKKTGSEIALKEIAHRAERRFKKPEHQTRAIDIARLCVQQDKTLEAAANLHGLTRERARQILAKLGLDPERPELGLTISHSLRKKDV